jgi:hypothetical protein
VLDALPERSLTGFAAAGAIVMAATAATATRTAARCPMVVDTGVVRLVMK